ncbi:MAG: hypothetical protein QOG68_2712 [Solirubrobacteraceae bacterium]|nr:hypothetical protein [Solirubrobacteraceae bacterium]
MSRTKIVPAVVVLFGVLAVAAIMGLQDRATEGRDAQLHLANLRVELTQMQSLPLQAYQPTGGNPPAVGAMMRASRQHVAQIVDQLQRQSPEPALAAVTRSLDANYAALDQLTAITAGSGTKYKGHIKQLVADAGRVLALDGSTMGGVVKALTVASTHYDDSASTADDQATAGSVLTILLLLGGFTVLYMRSARARASVERLARENARLAGFSHVEARTDALTGLGNRRALADELDAEANRPGGERGLVLALYDLDGFKQYNDTFGHPAGDVLLARLGERLAAALAGIGTAYRMGGDEFCVVIPSSLDDAVNVKLAADALCEIGGSFDISCSYGMAAMPAEAASSADALRLADQRMYEHKAGRSSASRQSGDVLLKVLSERNADLRQHVDGVAGLAERTAERLGLDTAEVRRIGLAAELHDIGKTAIPDAILHKAGPLDEHEWEFMRRHTLIGERILLAAPSLAPTAGLVRSTHEWFDGGGYPDGLQGDEIPLGASIIAVCDAYDAMVSERPYCSARESAAALAELRDCAGTQFNPAVVEVFCALAAERTPLPAAA